MEPPTPCGFEIKLVETKKLGTTVKVKTIDFNKVCFDGSLEEDCLEMVT